MNPETLDIISAQLASEDKYHIGIGLGNGDSIVFHNYLHFSSALRMLPHLRDFYLSKLFIRRFKRFFVEKKSLKSMAFFD
jgi:hypothetical protein